MKLHLTAEWAMGDVVDRADMFRRKKLDNQLSERFSKKAMAEVPGELRRQEDMEDAVDRYLNSLEADVDKMFGSQDRRALAPLWKGYEPDTTLLDVLYFHNDGQHDPDSGLAKDYILNHHDLLEHALNRLRLGLEKLRDEENKKDWPVGETWMKFTRIPELVRQLGGYLRSFFGKG